MNSKRIKIGQHELEVSHLDKVFFPKSGITKGDLLSYYSDVASFAVPLYENRPLTMQRCPEGITKECFIQKEIPNYFPQWIDRFDIPKKEGHLTQALINKKETLVYLADQACITFHLGLSKVDKIHSPRYLIFDIDPSKEDEPLLKNVVKHIKDLIDLLDLKGFIQTTGSRGFHIYIPLKREFSFKRVHDFSKKFAAFLAHKYPDEITIEQSKAKRGKRVLIDYVRNSYGMSAVAPYSVRTLENAPIATPLHWDEVADKNLVSQTYTIKNIFKRLSHGKDPWKGMESHHFSLDSAEKRLDKLF